MATKGKKEKELQPKPTREEILSHKTDFERLEEKVDALILRVDAFMVSFKNFKLNYTSNVMNRR